jgi:hypothetical protein
VPCGINLPPGSENPEAQRWFKSSSQDECVPGKSNAYVIVDAISGQILAGWHFGTRGGQ